MGYHAPSAEQVYRYLFHLDRPPGSLTDGFCWSILFVNDNSEWSREFLGRYGAELCFRTADRARFVFFSHLNNAETRLIAQGSGSGSFLSRLLARVGRTDGRGRYDYESPPWDDLRPEALYPLRTAEEVSHQLSMESEMNSAMPGAQEALLFAQRLGIARFVPCFVVFTEIGTSQIELLPTEGMSTADAFRRVRSWIDSFYEANGQALSYWRQVEQEIVAFCSESASSVSAVKRWADTRHESWQALRKVAATLLALDRAPLDETASVLRTLATDHSVPWEHRSAVAGLLKWLDELKARRHKRAALESRIRRVEQARTVDALRGELLELRSGALGVDHRRVTVALNQLDFPRPAVPPSRELVAWWRSDYGRPVSRNRYDHYRKAFGSFSERSHGISAKGRVGQLKRAEFEVCSEAAMTAPFMLPAQETADRVAESLAFHMQVDPADPAWVAATSAYRDHLRGRFVAMQDHAPSWLRSSAEAERLLVGDCIPPVDQPSTARLSSLEVLPRLKQSLESVEAAFGDEAEMAETMRNEASERVRGAMVAELRSFVEEGLECREGDIAAVRDTALQVLASVQSELSTFAGLNAIEASEVPFPGATPTGTEASRLLALLDRYDAEAAQVSFPFLRDRDMLRVGTPMPVVEAASREPLRAGRVDGASLLRHRVEEAQRSSIECADRWPVVRAEASELTPVGWLAGLVSSSLGEARAGGLASELGDPDLISALLRLGIVAVLDRLDVGELVRLEAASRSAQSWRPTASAGTKEDLYDAIMANGGLDVDPDRGFMTGTQPRIGTYKRRDLVEKVRRGQFDIFLAHNSVDREAVLRLGLNLRARGISPWIDVEQVPPGRWFQDVLQSVARRVASVGVVLGTSGPGRWQAVELRVFISRCVEDGIPVIPVLLPGVDEIPSNLVFLRELNAVAFKQSIDEDRPLGRLIWGITGRKEG